MTISYDDHHKHSRYLILSGGLPGFNPRERALIAQMSRYHRKGDPKLGWLEPVTPVMLLKFMAGIRFPLLPP